MGKKIDITGEKYGKLKVIKTGEAIRTKNGVPQTTWVCQCECGNMITVPTQSLRSGNTKSCGCLNEYDLTGKRFGRLTVIEKVKSKTNPCGSKSTMWKCICDCGNIVNVRTRLLTTSATKSCGCLNSELTSKRMKTHGFSNTHLYSILARMKARCENSHNNEYKNYGARGIKVCDEWSGDNGFENFAKWAYENGYDESKSRTEQSIDRIDVNGDYCPENCRWATMTEQQNNRRNNLYIEYNGETKTLSEWCRELSIPYNRTLNRIYKGWSVKEAFETPKLR